MVDWIEQFYIPIVEKGFRDALDIFNWCGYKTSMPPFLNEKQQ